MTPADPESYGLAEAVASKRVLVVTGAGGVGKTSIAAALAASGARSGRRTIVLTIDPARRLATALGLHGGIGHTATGVDLGGGVRMDAAMLDVRTAWDELVVRHASPEVASRMTANPIYAGLSQHFVGSQGYMAMERLAEIVDQSRYDLIVIDTPPSRHALDFIDAPKRLTDFVGGNLLRWFARPYARAGRLGARAFRLTASPVLKLADRLLGSDVLEDLASFVLDFNTMYDQFKARAEDVSRLLHEPTTAFVVVSNLAEAPLREAGFLRERLSSEQLEIVALVANRVADPSFASADASAAIKTLEEIQRTGSGDAATIAEALASLRYWHDRALDERLRIERAGRGFPLVARVPLLERDVHDLDSLTLLASALV